jgi:hypothetical protein
MSESPWTSPLESLATAYAAIVATAAFALEVRRWFAEGPKLTLRLVPDGVVTGDGAGEVEKDLLIVYVLNRGTEPTTIENLLLLEYPNLWRRWRQKSTRSFIVPRPNLKNYPVNVPFELEPNRRWTGIVRKRQGPADFQADLQSGNFYVGISASHTDRLITKRIPKPKPRPAANAESLGPLP